MVTNGRYFDIKRDMDYPCFCEGCLVGKTEAQMSKADTRYCLKCYNSLNGDNKQRTEPIDHWSECGQIFFHYSKGYGLTEDLRSICLGREVDIVKAFETGVPHNDLTPLQREVLMGILEYRKEEGFGTGKTGLVGASIDGTTGRKSQTARQSTPRKRLTLRSTKSKSKNLLRR